MFPISAQIDSAIDYAVSKGAILIASAGNKGSEIEDNSLAANDKVITVGSVDMDGMMSAWSNYGSELDLLAPWDVITLKNEDEVGTSFSAAFVAGITAPMLSENPDMTKEEVLEALKALTVKQQDAKEIKGVDIDEVLAMQVVEGNNRTDFTGYSPEMDIYTAPGASR